MGTNYYIRCRCCLSELKHIGKHSAGHPFLANMTKKEFIGLSIEHWEEVIDEYRKVITKKDLLNRVPIKWELANIKGDWC